MKKIDLGDGLTLPIEIITSTMAIFGLRGSGKTNGGAVIAEQVIALGQPVVAIDPTGSWYGLKSSRDGKHAGLPVYIFGGEHGDVPLEPTSGAVCARFVVEKRVPTVFDVSQMRMGARRRFVADLAEEISHRNKEPLLFILDEAPIFAPQMMLSRDVDAARCLGAIENLGTLDRRKGIGFIALAQRPAKLNATVRSQCENILVFRTTGIHDRKALEEWIVEHGDKETGAKMIHEMTSLPTGTAYFWSPGFLGEFRKVKVQQRETFDSGSTPKIGEPAFTPKVFAEIDRAALSAEITATVERVKADDPKTLRARIAELERQLAKAPTETIKTIEVEKIVERIILPDERVTQARHLLGELRDAANYFSEAAGLIRDVIARPEIEKAKAGEARGVRVIPPSTTPQPPPPKGAGPVHESTVKVNPIGLGKAQRAILTALAQSEPAGCDRDELGALSGYSSGTGHFANTLGALRAAGYIAPGSNPIRITAAGLDALGDYEPRPTGAALQDWWLNRLGKAERALLAALFENPHGLSRDQLGERSGYSAGTGHFANTLGKLRTLKLAEGSNPIRAARVFYS